MDAPNGRSKRLNHEKRRKRLHNHRSHFQHRHLCGGVFLSILHRTHKYDRDYKLFFLLSQVLFCDCDFF